MKLHEGLSTFPSHPPKQQVIQKYHLLGGKHCLMCLQKFVLLSMYYWSYYNIKCITSCSVSTSTAHNWESFLVCSPVYTQCLAQCQEHARYWKNKILVGAEWMHCGRRELIKSRLSQWLCMLTDLPERAPCRIESTCVCSHVLIHVCLTARSSVTVICHKSKSNTSQRVIAMSY